MDLPPYPAVPGRKRENRGFIPRFSALNKPCMACFRVLMLARRASDLALRARGGLGGLPGHGGCAAVVVCVGPTVRRTRLAAGHDVVDLPGIDGLVLDE